MNTTWRKYLVSGAMLYGENIFRLFYSVSILFLLRPLLSPDEFAGFAFYLSVAAVLYSCAKFSLDAYGIRDLVLLPKDAGNKQLASFIAIRATATALLCLIFSLLFSAYFYSAGPYIVLLISQIFRAFDSTEWRLRVDGDHWLQATIRTAGMAIAFSAILIAQKLNLDLTPTKASLIVSIEWIITSTAFITYIKRVLFKNAKFDSKQQIKPALATINEALPAHTSSLLTICYSRLDQLLLAPILATTAYGNYMLAARLNDALVVVILTLNMIITPILVRLHQTDFKKFVRSLRLISLAFFLMSIFIIFLIWVSTNLLIEDSPNFINGNFFPKETANWLFYFSFTTLITFSMGLRSTYFTIIRRPKTIFIGGIFGALFTCTAGAYLMKTCGEAGGVISVIGSTFIALFLSNFLTKDGRNFLHLLITGKI